ncbi:GumC family protein [Parabacteroides pacaensis]|uniref:GumC family protein n=1 Tax=Parabacteroides pacaensis TaxID=2086575 RepID=UPI000D0EE0C2|nr:hypothetical protein [Parabacteroides pacaensis]
MNIPLFISRFLYRIRYQLIFGSLIVTLLVAYFTQFLSKTYTVNTTIYTGIVSNTTLDNETINNSQVSNTFDNLISVLRSQSTLENVSLHLLAMNLIHGNPEENNMYITAKNFQRLERLIPDEIKGLIDYQSEEKTVENLKKYATNSSLNFIYSLLNGKHPHYSYDALKKVQIKRIGNSDMIDLSYQSDDPGITTNTIKLFNNELLNNYNELRYKATDDVIAYFEEEVKKKVKKLKELEDALVEYNVKHNIINYEEQTKTTAYSLSGYEDRYESVKRDYESAQQLVKILESQLETRSKLLEANNDFIKTLDEISTINGKITEIETFTSEQALQNNPNLERYKEELRKAEQKIASISSDMDQYKYTKEGVAVPDMVTEWLKALIQKTKAKAELKVLEERKNEFKEKYKDFSPIGTEIKRREREISVTESSYLESLHALNLAYLKKKNIQLTTSGLNTVTQPTFPLSPNQGKRLLLIIGAFLGSLIFITGYNLLIELLDRTLRDAERTERLTGLKVSAAFSGRGQLRFRGYSKAWNRISATYACNKLDRYLEGGRPIYINLLSIETGEGKSFIAQYLIEEWEKIGLNIKYIKIGEDITIDSSYLLASTFEEFCPSCVDENIDIFLIEYPAVQYNCLPPILINKASVNILVANSKRVWKNSDEKLLQHLKDISKDTSIIIYLNNASRETVEDFTGPLPPYSSQHSLAMQMMHMGFTAKGTSVTEK